MTTKTPEQEAFDLVIERHKNGAAEESIATAFQLFMAEADIAPHSEMTAQARPGTDGSGRMDLYVYNTCIEFKKDILSHGSINQGDIKQLDGYIDQLVKAGSGVRNGILTDGVNYLIRHVGTDKLLIEQGEAHTVFDKPEQAHLLREYLYKVISEPAVNISPTAPNLERYFGNKSDAFRVGNLLLQEAYEAHRDNPTVAVKRSLWQDLLQVALGKDAATDGNESDWLFIRHTYITSLVALIMQQQLLGEVADHASHRPDDLLKGQILAEQSDLHGIIDADLFTWPTEVGEPAYLREIARVVEQFDWTQNPTEVAPTLYQNVITQEERKKLGEYYTPRWLAREITETVVDDPLDQRVLDPSCGSGTFIETAVERILEHAKGLTATERLRKLQENVVGIDIHPVAVQLAKATWVMAAADTIRAAREEDPNSGAVSAPIYLGDSMQLRYDTGTLSASQFIELETREKIPGQPDPITFSIPKELARQQTLMDQIIAEIATAIDDGQDPDHVVDQHQMSGECSQGMKAVAALMKDLHDAKKNHVWAYYIRNMIRPAVIAEQKLDRIIGNPPWLTYGQSADIIRQELKDMSEKRYQIWAGGKLAPHQDIATLFYTRCAELYAKSKAIIGMVMPHSALRTGQHLKWRGGNYQRKGKGNPPNVGLNLQIKEPWDLDNVVPDFFPIPASVVFAQYTEPGQGTALAPAKVQVWRGNWEKNYAGITKLREALHHDDGKFKSPYAELSSQGPTIVDRRLFFVEETASTAMIQAANTTNVKPRLGGQDKIKYEEELKKLEGVVSHDHLFDVYLGECVAPFVTLDPLRAALPVHRPTMTMEVDHSKCNSKHEACRLEVETLHQSMKNRWNSAAEMFHEAHKDKAIKCLYERLNYQNILTNQLEYLRTAIAGGGTVRVAYTTSGTPTATIIRDNHAIVDHVLFQTICNSEDEAHYILNIINSSGLAEATDSFMPKGLYGARHFHKHGWKLPIPRYDGGDPLHLQLSQLGKVAEQECRNIVDENEIMSKSPGKAQSDAARKLLRHEWQPNSKTSQAIEAAVAQLLSDPEQSKLAEQQMQAA